ncbi:MAG: methyltransferase domain-containing protein [Candidatus Cloacimonetes bacterium]|nr:methyltransferase domain-containing protein [Candidatus Cloacimonadota bacterium]
MKDKIEHYDEEYDHEAEATGWLGPEVSFGLLYKFLKPGQKVLDIGIGTGLSSELFYKAGLKIYGMDFSDKMLDAVKQKGITEDLALHDLTELPYPYSEDFFDIAVCAGVFNFFKNLGEVFTEVSRILKNNGYFSFVVGHRRSDEDSAVLIGSEHTGSDRTVTMYRHSSEQIQNWLTEASLKEIRSVEFTVFMDKERTRRIPAKAYIVQKM